MLIPNKFSGYQVDGRRLYPIGGGVGEAMLLGAAVGGGSAAITGGDPLKGALLGGLTGGIGGGVSGALAGGAEAAATSSLLPAGQSFAQASQAANAATQAAQAAAAAQAPAAALNSAMASALPVSGSLGSSIPGMTAGAPTMFSAAPAAGSQGIAGIMQAAAPTSAVTAPAAVGPAGGTFMEGASRFASDPMASLMRNKFTAGAAGLAGAMGGREPFEPPSDEYDGPLKRFRFNPDSYRPAFAAEGGIMSLAGGGYDRMVGGPSTQYMADGGISSLGSYSDGGRMLKGPGDGMSDSIPASIGGKRPARLADGEFVVPADVVSHLGNGSTDAGAKQLYAMMDKVRSARTGTKKQGRQINPGKFVPA